WLVGDDPAERGLRPYGATGPLETAAQAAAAQKAQRVSVLDALGVPQFWLLMATFFVCGYTSNGMVLTHFMPHALEHNFSELQAGTALGVMGAMNVLGTVGSGWIFFAHQVGAALGAALAGWVYEWTGAYTIAFVSAALMGFLAAGLALAIREEPILSPPMGAPAPAAS